MMENQFALDKPNAKLMGVCAGVARWTGIDPTVVRVGTVLLAFVAGPVAALAYFVTGLVAEPR